MFKPQYCHKETKGNSSTEAVPTPQVVGTHPLLGPAGGLHADDGLALGLVHHHCPLCPSASFGETGGHQSVRAPQPLQPRLPSFPHMTSSEPCSREHRDTVAPAPTRESLHPKKTAPSSHPVYRNASSSRELRHLPPGGPGRTGTSTFPPHTGRVLDHTPPLSHGSAMPAGPLLPHPAAKAHRAALANAEAGKQALCRVVPCLGKFTILQAHLKSLLPVRLLANYPKHSVLTGTKLLHVTAPQVAWLCIFFWDGGWFIFCHVTRGTAHKFVSTECNKLL